jgi:hypothetical protein
MEKKKELYFLFLCCSSRHDGGVERGLRGMGISFQVQNFVILVQQFFFSLIDIHKSRQIKTVVAVDMFNGTDFYKGILSLFLDLLVLFA